LARKIYIKKLFKLYAELCEPNKQLCLQFLTSSQP